MHVYFNSTVQTQIKFLHILSYITVQSLCSHCEVTQIKFLHILCYIIYEINGCPLSTVRCALSAVCCPLSAYVRHINKVFTYIILYHCAITEQSMSSHCYAETQIKFLHILFYIIYEINGCPLSAVRCLRTYYIRLNYIIYR